MNKDILTQNRISTRNLIMSRSLELINRMGMMDFRIDFLASSLKLSPGNVTYHFSRKEDICSGLWEEFMAKVDIHSIAISGMLDLKQCYLICRAIVTLVYDYRGVVMYRGGDVRIIADDESMINIGTSYTNHIITLLRKMVTMLRVNGYINELDKGEFSEDIECSIILLSRYAINGEYMNFTVEEQSKMIDRVSLIMLYSIYNILSEKGQKEFKFISDLVNKNEMTVVL